MRLRGGIRCAARWWESTLARGRVVRPTSSYGSAHYCAATPRGTTKEAGSSVFANAFVFGGLVSAAGVLLWSQSHAPLACEKSKIYPVEEARRRILPVWESLEADLDRELEAATYTTPRNQVYKKNKGVTVSLKGKVLSVRFPLRPGSDVSALLVDVVGKLSRSNPMSVEAWDSAVAKHLSFSAKGDTKDSLRMMLFTPLVGYGLQEIEFIKEGSLGEEDLGIIVNAVSLSARVSMEYQEFRKAHPKEPEGGFKLQEDFPRKAKRSRTSADQNQKKNFPSADQPAENESVTEEELVGLGARVYRPGNTSREAALDACAKGDMDKLWGNLAGYDYQKRQIEDSLLLNLLDPSTLNKITKGTREKYASNLPKAVLFDGPPGTGKTSSARALASMAVTPLVYVPIESMTSKYYGESEKILSQIFRKCSSLRDGCIIFLDEVDSLVTSRGGSTEMHEASRRILGVLLKEVDGFEEGSRSIVIAATNRKQDLDAALLNRFDTIIHFGLPDAACRTKILQKYAKHLDRGQLEELGEVSEGFSGRDLKDICLQAERQWASKIVRKEAEWSLPPFEAYVNSVKQRKES